MTSKKRKILDPSLAPVRVSQFRESLQGAFETCDARAYAEHVAQDVCLSFQDVSCVNSIHLDRRNRILPRL